MAKELTKEQRDNQIKTEIINFNNCGKILTVEKDIIAKFIKNRKPVLNREGNDGMGMKLNMLGMSFITVIKHLDDRITELQKILDKENK